VYHVAFPASRGDFVEDFMGDPPPVRDGPHVGALRCAASGYRLR
jgi:hypothetical protein